MEYNHDKVDDMVLALLWLTNTGDGRAWKNHDWDTLDRLYEKGFISSPVGKAKSIALSEEGNKRSRELFEQYFSSPETPK